MEVLEIGFEENVIYIKTRERGKKALPLQWFPRLEKATQAQRENYELSSFGIHWKELDEDLSFEGFLKFDKEAKSFS